jgi:hypothetical protein
MCRWSIGNVPCRVSGHLRSEFQGEEHPCSVRSRGLCCDTVAPCVTLTTTPDNRDCPIQRESVRDSPESTNPHNRLVRMKMKLVGLKLSSIKSPRSRTSYKTTVMSPTEILFILTDKTRA